MTAESLKNHYRKLRDIEKSSIWLSRSYDNGQSQPKFRYSDIDIFDHLMLKIRKMVLITIFTLYEVTFVPKKSWD